MNLLALDRNALKEDRSALERRFNEETASFINWMVHPYAISFAIVFFGYFMLQAPLPKEHDSMMRGIGFAVLVYLLVCSWQLRDSLLVRPHPVFWRIVKGLAFLYLFGLVFLSFQSVDSARQLLTHWDVTLGVPLKEQSYAVSCDVYTPDDPVSSFRNIHDAFFNEEGRWIFADVFIVSHVLGWFCKMVMIRDVRLVFMGSVLFEIYEISLKHMLANFKECWWDSFVLDVILCNGFGMFLGYHWLKFFNCKQYNFLGSVTVTDENGKAVRRWKPLVKFRYLLGPLIVLGSLAAIELNAFFLKFILWVPAPHHLNLLRVIFWWLLGCCATRELYYKVNHPEGKTGMMISLLVVLASTEGLICWKMSTGLFTTPAPMEVTVSWTITLVSLFLFMIIYFPLQHIRSASKKAEGVPSASGASDKAEGAPVASVDDQSDNKKKLE